MFQVSIFDFNNECEIINFISVEQLESFLKLYYLENQFNSINIQYITSIGSFNAHSNFSYVLDLCDVARSLDASKREFRRSDNGKRIN